MYERLKFALSMKKLVDELVTKQITTLTCLNDMLACSADLNPVKTAIQTYYNTAIQELLDAHKKAVDEITAFIGKPLEFPEPECMSEPEAMAEVFDRR